MSAYAYTMNNTPKPMTPTAQAIQATWTTSPQPLVHATVTYHTTDPHLSVMRVSLTSGRIRNPGADDADIARKIIAIRRGLPVQSITVVAVDLDA